MYFASTELSTLNRTKIETFQSQSYLEFADLTFFAQIERFKANYVILKPYDRSKNTWSYFIR